MKTYRIVTHAHSTWSYDGSWTVAALAKTMSRFGAHVLMMTEHSQRFDRDRFDAYFDECQAASTGGIRVIPGIEYSSPNNEIHILTWGLNHYLEEEMPVDAILQEVQKAGGLAVFAHPKRRDVWNLFEADWAGKLHGMELWNRKTDSLVRSQRALDLIRKHDLRPIVSLDFHNKKQFYPLYNGLVTNRPLSALTDQEFLALMRDKGTRPYFAGLPVDDAPGLATSIAHAVCPALNNLHGFLRRKKKS